MLQIKFENLKAGSWDYLQSVAVKVLLIFKVILSKMVLKNKHFKRKNLNLRLNLSTTVIVGEMTGTDLGSFSSPPPPHLQIFTCIFVHHTVQLLWKFTYRLIRPRQTYLVFILNLVKPLVTLMYWSSCEVGGWG